MPSCTIPHVSPGKSIPLIRLMCKIRVRKKDATYVSVNRVLNGSSNWVFKRILAEGCPLNTVIHSLSDFQLSGDFHFTCYNLMCKRGKNGVVGVQFSRFLLFQIVFFRPVFCSSSDRFSALPIAPSSKALLQQGSCHLRAGG